MSGHPDSERSAADAPRAADLLEPRTAEPTKTVAYTPSEADGPGPEPTVSPRERNGAAPEVAGYEILGVLGRGGMGVVYKARQPGLKRLVALKMVLAGGHAGAGDLVRFRAEAEAVARLQHPNIVQIYEVGEEDGRPFFSLEYVDGGSLATRIAGTPQPPRDAAKLLHALAPAVEYAHQHAVLHRDLKPANILLAFSDASQKRSDAERFCEASLNDFVPKITDFGLAKRLEEDAGQTQSGSIIGTPNYMGPEQAAGRIRAVGPAADVYGLGAILYELLTGRPPFKAATALETLELVRVREPVAPTQLQPKIPRDMETICLKCLHKEPQRRYASAQELADDLRRFLAGEPIRARPVSGPERLWRWCRRNPRVALLSATTALVVVVWAVTSSVLAWHLHLQQQETEQARAVAAANEAMAKAKAAEARAKEQEAKANADRAAGNARVARTRQGQALGRMIGLGEQMERQLRGRRLAAALGPAAGRLREDLLTALRQSLAGLAKDLEGTDVTAFGTAAIHQHMGDLLLRLGQGEKALQLFRLATDVCQREAKRDPNSDKARANLAVMLWRLGDLALELKGDARGARGYYREANALLKEVEEHPRSGDYSKVDGLRLLSHAAARLGNAELALGEPEAAAGHFEEARRRRQAWSEAEPKNLDPRSFLAEAHLRLAITATHKGDKATAKTHFDQALAHGTALAKDVPRNLSYRGDLADIYGELGDAQLCQGENEAAAKSYEQAWQHLQAATQGEADDPSLLPLVALTHERMAASLRGRKLSSDAEKHLREALRLREELVRTEAVNLTWKAAYLLTLARVGKHVEAARGAAALSKEAPESCPLQLQAARCFTSCAEAAGDAEAKQAYTKQALEALRAATRPEFRDWAALRTDPDLAPLRQDAAFRKLVTK
jgi:serine/threonine protein kinase